MEYEKNKLNSFLLIFILFFSMFAAGMSDGFTGVALPLIKSEFSASSESQGFFNAAVSLGSVIACLFSSFALYRMGIKNTVLLGCFLALGAMATMSLVPSFVFAGLVFMLMRMGVMCYEMGINGHAATLSASPGRMISFTHFFYGVGAIFAPAVAGLFIGGGILTWRTIYLVGAGMIALLMISTSSAKFHAVHKTEAPLRQPPTQTVGKLIKNPAVWFFALILSYIGQAEASASLWGTIYLQKMFSYDPVTQGAAFLSAFFLLFTLARLVSGVFIEKIGYAKTIYISLIATIITLLLGFLLLEGGVWILALSGFFVSIIWPAILAIMAKVFGSGVPVAISIATTISGANSILLQLFTGYLGQIFGVEWGYRISLLYSFISTLLFFALMIYLRRKKIYRDAV